MKLALYLPNFRDKVTVSELVDLARVAEELEFDSIWTLDRIVVPEASDRGELIKPFGFMKEFPRALPVIARGEFLHGLPLIPYLAAITRRIRLGVSIIDTPYRAPGVMAAEIATWDHLAGGRINVGVGSGWMPEEFDAASATHIYEKRNRHVIETIEIMQGVWTQDLFEYHGEFASFPKCGFGVKPVQKPHPPIFFGGLGVPKIAARRVAKYGLAGWIGIQDTPDDIARWRAAIKEELERVGSSVAVEELEISSMLFFDITREKTDQTPRGKLTPSMTGTPQQLIDNLRRYRDAGLTLPLLWPPFRGVPTAKTIVDLRRLKEEIIPKAFQ
ncbi:MAG TPA: LLM class flavin-dependent oxidoreductase [Candidatus Binataceae bacterium]|jgi:alkanesulfonate monooxygenase SsuD/methylene tetrahydromethanopterin reductase-like flavin-dependent oxidoreductase (luciferase family)|nr:LLM class flavin-dependent oxidoreductase [Candidatus Binataceae bacterium]